RVHTPGRDRRARWSAETDFSEIEPQIGRRSLHRRHRLGNRGHRPDGDSLWWIRRHHRQYVDEHPHIQLRIQIRGIRCDAARNERPESGLGLQRSSMVETKTPARTYNQNHLARPYIPGKRRFSVYWTWSYPWESNRDVTELDNRFSTMTEVRR